MHRLLLAASFVVGACARDARVVEAEIGEVPRVAARVCVMRPQSLAGEVTMEIRDNARLVGATRGATYACWLAAPGAHQITSIDDDTGPTYLEARAGQHYWLHQDISRLDGALHAHLDWVDDRTAAEMLDRCSARVKVALPGHDDLVPVSPRL